MGPADAFTARQVDQVQLARDLLVRHQVAGGDVEGEDEVGPGGVLVHVGRKRRAALVPLADEILHVAHAAHLLDDQVWNPDVATAVHHQAVSGGDRSRTPIRAAHPLRKGRASGAPDADAPQTATSCPTPNPADTTDPGDMADQEQLVKELWLMRNGNGTQPMTRCRRLTRGSLCHAALQATPAATCMPEFLCMPATTCMPPLAFPGR